jgi:gamma-glutamyl hercynylcysteine S-oxide synthase
MHSTVSDRAKLLAILGNEEAALAARIAAGEALSKLGDERATAVDRVLIPAGPFLYRGGATEDDAQPSPPMASLQVHVSAFHIDRFPVTVAAYAEFIAAGGYQDRKRWSKAGWAFRARAGIEHPRFWGDEAWSAYLSPNHPVVGVSVYEAEAYAAFRGARLPTEAEWEKAARGTDGRRYPWGNTWIEDACGSRTVGPRGTVPIGCYPKGRSPFGLYDVVGCVWQWCADVADEDAPLRDRTRDPFVNPDEYDDEANRVTRGGGWNNLQWSISCTSRNGYPPTAQFSNLGFRCAVDGP